MRPQMSVCRIMAAGAAATILAAGGALLCISAFSSVGATETQIARTETDEERSQTIAPSKPTGAPAPVTRTQSKWVVNCSNSQAGLDCRAVQSVFLKRTRKPFLSLTVRVPPDRKPIMLIQAPLGIYVPAGVILQFGKGLAKSVPLQSCNLEGCLAEYAIAESEIAAMLKGQDLTISAQTPKKELAFTLKVTTNGFEAAYAKIK